MTANGVRLVLRLVAVAIAVLAIFDPVLMLDAAPGTPIVVVAAARDASAAAAELRRLRGSEQIIERPLVNQRVPCGVDERCVVVADGSAEAKLPRDLAQPPSLIVSEPAPPNIRVRSVVMPSRLHAATAAVASIDLDGAGMAGRRSEVRLTDGEAVVGSTVHEWAADGQVSIEVPWWPLAVGARAIRVTVVPSDGETASYDNAIDLGVQVTTERARVLVFDARPSWQSTFVRRSLEDDPRFRVEHRARLAPAIAAGTADGRLDAATLRNIDALVLSGLDAMTAGDVDEIERFVRAGGSAVLLPDRAPSGPTARLFIGDWRERLRAEPSAVGLLRSGELLTAAAALPTSTVLASAGDAPVIVATPLAEGLIVVAGAMDAWRHRDANADAFDRFWRSLLFDAASARNPLRITFEEHVAAAGARLPFTVSGASGFEVSAVGRCADGAAQAVRLWPSGTKHVFRGELTIGGPGSCALEVVAGDRRAEAAVAVLDRPIRPARQTLERIENDVRHRGGIVTSDGDLSPIAAALDAEQSRRADRRSLYPMRSSWWIVPFAALLSSEWWRRRRAGLH
jgi:hypothetical protein